MRRMHPVMAAMAFAAIGSFVALAQAPQQPPAGQAPAAGAQQPAGGRQGGRAGGGAANPTSFFVTSVGKGDGANYGGLAGADAYCAERAKAANLPTPQGRTWRAYLSATAQGGQPAVNARDRIQINTNNALSETGMPIAGVGEKPNQHDIITGSDSHGRARASETVDTTCSNYTSNQDPPAGTARGQGPGVWLGHHDRMGGGNSSWNAAHKSGGCSQQALVNTGGAGLLYCFAAN